MIAVISGFMLIQESYELVWCIRHHELSHILKFDFIFIWKNSKLDHTRELPSKRRGRLDIKGLSNCCERFATYTLLGHFYSDKSVYQQEVI